MLSVSDIDSRAKQSFALLYCVSLLLLQDALRQGTISADAKAEPKPAKARKS